MKKLSVILIVILVVTLSACNDNAVKPSVSPATNSVLMPLEIGNTWTYKTYVKINDQPFKETSGYVITIWEEVDSNGYKYYIANYRENDSNQRCLGSMYVRNTVSGLSFSYYANINSPCVFLPYKTYEGFSFKIYNGILNYRVKDVSYLVTGETGRHKCIRYSYYEPHPGYQCSNILSHDILYEPDLGLVYEKETYETDGLLSQKREIVCKVTELVEYKLVKK